MKSISHYLLFFGLIFLFSCTPSNKKPPEGLEGTWLSVSQREEKWGGSGSFTGYFMEIKSGNRTYQFAYSDTMVYEDVLYTHNSIVYPDSNKIMISYISKDSIQLAFPQDSTIIICVNMPSEETTEIGINDRAFQPDTTIVTYVKLPFEETGQIRINDYDLTDNEWYLIDEEKKYRVDFVDYDFYFFYYDISFNKGYNLFNWGEYFGWNIMEYDNQTYLISTSLFEPTVFQITKYKNDTIDLIYFDDLFSNSFKHLKLVKSKPLSKEKHQQQVEKLANHQFKLVDYSFESQYEEGTWDTVIIKRINRFFTKFGIGKEMTFSFTNDSLFITNNIGGEYLKGAWQLSKDGHNIKVVNNNDLFMMGIKHEEDLHLNINGFSNIRKIYNGCQVDYLELELVEY